MFSVEQQSSFGNWLLFLCGGSHTLQLQCLWRWKMINFASRCGDSVPLSAIHRIASDCDCDAVVHSAQQSSTTSKLPSHWLTDTGCFRGSHRASFSATLRLLLCHCHKSPEAERPREAWGLHLLQSIWTSRLSQGLRPMFSLISAAFLDRSPSLSVWYCTWIFEVLQERKCKEMLAVPYLVLHWISFLFFALFA